MVGNQENRVPDPSTFDDTKLRYSVTECLEVLGISRKHFYAQLRAGVYETIRDGNRRFMTRDQLMAAAAGSNEEKAL